MNLITTTYHGHVHTLHLEGYPLLLEVPRLSPDTSRSRPTYSFFGTGSISTWRNPRENPLFRFETEPSLEGGRIEVLRPGLFTEINGRSREQIIDEMQARPELLIDALSAVLMAHIKEVTRILQKSDRPGKHLPPMIKLGPLPAEIIERGLYGAATLTF